MFRDQSLTLNYRYINEPNNMYPWKSYLMNMMNYSREVQDTRQVCVESATRQATSTGGRMTATI